MSSSTNTHTITSNGAIDQKLEEALRVEYDVLTIDGDANILGSSIKQILPKRIVVNGSFSLLNCTMLESVSPAIKTDGFLSFRNCKRLENLPDRLVVGGQLDLTNTRISTLPDHNLASGNRFNSLVVFDITFNISDVGIDLVNMALFLNYMDHKLASSNEFHSYIAIKLISKDYAGIKKHLSKLVEERSNTIL